MRFVRQAVRLLFLIFAARIAAAAGLLRLGGVAERDSHAGAERPETAGAAGLCVRVD